MNLRASVCLYTLAFTDQRSRSNSVYNLKPISMSMWPSAPTPGFFYSVPKVADLIRLRVRSCPPWLGLHPGTTDDTSAVGHTAARLANLFKHTRHVSNNKSVTRNRVAQPHVLSWHGSNSRTRWGADRGHIVHLPRLIAKFYYTHPTGPDQTKSADFVWYWLNSTTRVRPDQTGPARTRTDLNDPDLRQNPCGSAPFRSGQVRPV